MTLPNQLDPTQPPDTQDESLGAARIREFRQFLLDVLGMPANVPITAPYVAGDGSGLKHVYFQDNVADPTVNGELVRAGANLKVMLAGTVFRLNQYVNVNSKAFRNGAFTIPAGVGGWSIMPFDTVAWDSGGLFSSPLGGWLVPVLGVYQVNLQCDFGLSIPSTTQFAGVSIMQSGALIQFNLMWGPLRTLEVSGLALLNAGDYIQMGLMQSTGVPQPITPGIGVQGSIALVGS